MPDHVRPPVTERPGGQPLRKWRGNNVLWIAVHFEDRGVESPVRRRLVPPLLGRSEAGLPARILIEAVERHVSVAGVEALGDDVTVGDDHEWRYVRVQVGACDEEPGADSLLVGGLDAGHRPAA